MQLRWYQKDQVTDLRQGIRAKSLIQMLMSPTGSGKTEVAKHIIASAAAKKRKVWFIVDSVKLLDQTLARFHSDGLYAGAIQANHPWTDYSKVIQVATVQSLASRLDHLLREQPPELVVIDEAHVVFKAHTELIAWCRRKGVPVIGLSATPFKRGLGLIYDRLVNRISTAELTEQGYLVPAECYAPNVPNLKGVATNSEGDWTEDELAKVMAGADIMGDVVPHWKMLGENRQTLVFACNVKHAKQLAEAFMAEGIPAAYIDGYMHSDESDRIIALYKAGKIKVLVSVAMLIKGFDDPQTGCIVIARPTKSLMLHYQMLGRVLRIAEGKEFGIIIDHAGNLLRNGLPTDALPDRLDMNDGDPVDRRKSESNPDKQQEEAKACPHCKYVMTGLLCTKCGFEIVIDAGVEVAKGVLVKLADRKKKLTTNTKQSVFAELLGYAQARNKGQMWAQGAYNAFMGEPIQREWVNQTAPAAPGEPIEKWVKGYNMRRAKSKRRA
ncbi:DEAD/DEAH box helicase [Stutzerimonas stutzeri]|uniref:DEAD/DEAH box helicase n=1 Tax=Stutzerimonas stutzeri TaxID=316 RepID=UPI001E7D4985|nr:DEAD/DEAH box helicase [Stutzerimonas stutzeri]CAB5556398.1 type I restriction enzyme EcoKI subunit R [Stutzerimonas stutzeri]CAB5598179.1 type I restriction enzyme EcoKI subunit R [Stutzerimonas stutzeri]CAC9158932.1 type I restriction enzyme EcoKI subunit R [Stutzerimonas stutzeri]CAD0188338.1 Metabolism_regulation [Stutzerimonas stutzeri]